VSAVFFVPDDTDRVIASALAEDLGVDPGVFAPESGPADVLSLDITTSAVLGEDARFAGRITARESCVVAGLPVAARVFQMLVSTQGLWTENFDMFPLVPEGARVDAGTPLAEIEGLASVVLAGERTALNLLQTLSGIATEAARWQAAAGEELAVCDSRKTWPGLRSLAKYAVRVGGGTNHRMGLFDAVLVKDNHLRGASVTDAVARCRAAAPDVFVQIEADSLAQALEAVSAGADAVLLDNFADEDLAAAVSAVRRAADERGRPCVVEVSGGVTFERLPVLAQTGADRVSTSRITLAAPVDIALDAD